ncbi:DDE superfamily endonuclease [Popillia japonica]|uniref:DDE superfamily endonuclease n=1 Tax=Popillia japonica TaxID=7064 RepID=A0AAW1KNX3_POPJA
MSLNLPGKILILDGHASYKDLDVIEFARKNHIHMLSTPPYTTHELQPRDHTFMMPFKSAYKDACASWMRSYPGVRISEYEIAGFVASAFKRCMCLVDEIVSWRKNQ